MFFERSRKGEHALLIQPHAGGPVDEGLLEEFSELARSAGASIAGVLSARIDRPNAATLIGSGKLEEVKAAADATGADLILVNHPLTPTQERNLERALQRRLDKVQVQRTQMRRARMRSELPRVALVGYTNAGKSTLFNAMTGAEAYAADQLFATLDPTVRRIDLAGGGAVLADTVGFVRDLPHALVAAFRSTLSEARDADLLLHVVDAADPLRDERVAQVNEVLAEIGAADLPQVLVFNKIDRVEGGAPRLDRPAEGPPRVWLSARDGVGLDLLRDAIGEVLGLQRVQGRVHVPSRAGRLRARLHELGAVRGEQAGDDGWEIQVDLALVDAQRLAAQAGGTALQPLIDAALPPDLG